MDFILWVLTVAAVLSLGIILGAVFHAIISADAKDAADEFVKAKNSVLAEYESIVARLRKAEQDVANKKVL